MTMLIWLDAHLSPELAPWIAGGFSVRCLHVQALGLLDSDDGSIFNAARSAGAVLMTKDADLVRRQEQSGAPPQLIWLTCGNTSNACLKSVLSANLGPAIRLLETGEPLVELT